MNDPIREILTTVAYRKIDVDALLDPDHPMWVAFDPELGYVPADVVMKDGMDYSKSTYTHEPGGQRRMVNYGDQPCRVNTYGDSFTQCQQVSDDETWQERLAAHIGEPIRNFGSGGYSVVSACNRARRMEATEEGAEHVIINIFDDDHIRNLDAARWIRTAWNERDRPADKAYPLHGLPWGHLRFDLDQGTWVEKPGLCKTEDDLRALGDTEKFYETFKDDQIVKLFALSLGYDVPVDEFEQLAEALGIKVDLRNPDTLKDEVERLHRGYGFKSTEYLLDEIMFPWAEKNNKKIMIMLSYCLGSIAGYCTGAPRFDDVFLDYLNRNNIPYWDTLAKHAEDYADFGCGIEKYIARYFIQAAGAAVFGHYNPTGNHFCAFSIKNEMVEWLNPNPPAYREE